MIANIIQPGNKVDLCMMQQIEQERRTGVRAHIYKSQVVNIFADDELELSMPTEAGKMVMLPIGIRFEFVFYSQGGLYRGLGLVKERYKTNNMYMLRASLKSQLHKFQRREYFRMPCVIDMEYYNLTAEQALSAQAGRYESSVEQPAASTVCQKGSIVDISGGGARFLSDAESRNDSYIMIKVKLSSAEDSEIYQIPAHILSSFVSSSDCKKFETRVEFVIRDRKIREEIIRYIFDEKRRNRIKERSADEP